MVGHRLWWGDTSGPAGGAGAEDQPSTGWGRGCAVMIVAEVAVKSAVPVVAGAETAAVVPEHEERLWPWVSPGPSANRRGAGGAGLRAPASRHSRASRPVERCPDPDAGAAHPPVAG